jgi:hypothetical protein
VSGTATHRRAYTEDAPPPPSRWTPFRVAWLAVLVGTVAFRAYTLSQWSWLQDDFQFTSRVPGSGLAEYITQDVTGHVFPGVLLISWVMTTLAPMDYLWAAVSICVFSGAVVVGWGLALRELFGERLHLVAVLLVLALTPGSTLIAHWWISGIEILPMQAAMGFCVWFLARYLQRGRRRRDLVWLNVSYALGLFMWEKSLLITVPLLFVCLLLGTGTLRRDLAGSVRVLWPTGVLTAGYLALYLWAVSRGPAEGGAEIHERTLDSAASMVGSGTLHVVLPTLVGGPFGRPESAVASFDAPGVALSVALGLAAVAFVTLGLVVRRRGGRAVALVLVYVAISWGLLFFSNRFPAFGPDLIEAPRYSADVIPVVMLAGVFLATALAGETDPFRRPVAERTAGLARRLGATYVVVVLAAVAVTSVRTWDSIEPTSTKPYVDTLVGEATALG